MSSAEAFREPSDQDYRAALVRFYKGTTVAGCGFRVSRHYILTCAHVVTQCLGWGKKHESVLKEQVEGKKLEIDFPDVSRQRQAVEIIPELWRGNQEDIAVLKLVEPLPLSSEMAIITLKSGSAYQEHHFQVYGYPEGHLKGVWVHGALKGKLIGSDWIQAEGTDAQGLSIKPGYSGSPFWNKELGGVIGMTVAADTVNESAKIGFLIPYEKLKPVLEAIALFELLLPEATNLVSHWKNAYRLLRSNNSTEAYPATLQEAILRVQDITPQGSDYRPIDRFIGYLALPELGLYIQPSLIQWLGTQVADVDALLETVMQGRAIQQQQAALNPHLLFWVQAELNSDRYSVQAYLVKNRDQYDPLKALQLTTPALFLEKSEDEKVDCLEIEQILRECLDESIEQLSEVKDLSKLRIEVFLPLACLDWQVDSWFADEQTIFIPKPESIGSRYNLVIRIAERLNPQICKPQMRALWSAKWHTLTQIQTNPAHHGLISGDQFTPEQISDELRRAEIVGFYLTQAPQPFTQDNPGLFPVLVGTGAPVAIWLRQNISDDCKQSFEQLLACCLAELSTHIRNVRSKTDAKCDSGEIHLKQHISLIWEDAELVPPGAVHPSRLRMPA